MTLADAAWTLVFFVLLVLLMGGGMFVAAAYLTPAVLGSPNGLPREGSAKVAEFVFLFAGMAVGIGLALGAICFLSRNYVSTATHQRWALQLENAASELSPPVRALSRFLMRCMQPRGGANAL